MPSRGRDTGPLKALARKCAANGLKLDDAVALFLSLYYADALALAGGNVSKAAEQSGIARTTIARHSRRARAQGDDQK